MQILNFYIIKNLNLYSFAKCFDNHINKYHIFQRKNRFCFFVVFEKKVSLSSIFKIYIFYSHI